MSTRIQNWSASPAYFAETSLAALFKKVMEQIELCAVKSGVDEVHDLRVSIRRFSQALRIFGPMLSAKRVKAIRKALHPAMEAAGCVRDLDVGVDRLIEEGLGDNDPVLQEMHAERHRGELALRGRLLLLKSKEPESNWPGALRIQIPRQEKQEGGTP